MESENSKCCDEHELAFQILKIEVADIPPDYKGVAVPLENVVQMGVGLYAVGAALLGLTRAGAHIAVPNAALENPAVGMMLSQIDEAMAQVNKAITKTNGVVVA